MAKTPDPTFRVQFVSQDKVFEVFAKQIYSSGTMVDMSVTDDHLKSRVEGVIYGARVVSITPVGEETYETKLALPQSTIDELVRNYLQTPSAGR